MWEFVLFDAQACIGLATILIGYSERQGKVIQYLRLRQPGCLLLFAACLYKLALKPPRLFVVVERNC